MMAPDEVRKLDNRKCVVLVRGFDPVIDEKYNMLEKNVFKEASDMGPYCRKKEKENLYETGRQGFYLEVKGEEGNEQSYRMQTEMYKGIFEESEVYAKLQPVNEAYLILPDSYHGYVINEMEAFSVYDREVQYVKSGNGLLHKHLLIGYCLEGEIITVDENDREAFFNEGNRVTVLMRAMM